MQSLAGSPIGTAGFAYLPERGIRDGELKIYAAHLREVDAALAVAMRVVVEHFAGQLAMPVTMMPPAEPEVWLRFHHMLGEALPRRYRLGEGAKKPEGDAPSSVLMPACTIRHYDEADRIRELIPEALGGNYGMRPMRYIAGAFGILIENALTHGADSTVGAIGAISFERDEDLLRLAVCDTAKDLVGDGDSEERLIAAIEQSEENGGGLAGLAEQATRLEIDAQITLAAGNAKISWEPGGAWKAEQSQFIPGAGVLLDIRR
jgi:hypothetical protein